MALTTTSTIQEALSRFDCSYLADTLISLYEIQAPFMELASALVTLMGNTTHTLIALDALMEARRVTSEEARKSILETDKVSW